MPSTSDQIIGIESGGNQFAKNPRSSAYGPGQFIDSTWLNTLSRHRPDLTTGRSREELLSLRSDPSLARDMTEAYAADNGRLLANAGLPVTPGTTYLAHFAGPQGAVNVLKADPSAPAGSILGDQVVAANPFLRGMSAGDLAAWADRKMTGGSAPSAPAGAAPAGLLAQGPTSPGLLGGGQNPQASQSGLASIAAGLLNPKQQPLLQPQLMAALPRKRIDLSALQAMANG
jgi:hypothetical protein